jgi:hypothetical protein
VQIAHCRVSNFCAGLRFDGCAKIHLRRRWKFFCDIADSLDQLSVGFSTGRLRASLGGTATVGALRLSVGLPPTLCDIDRALVIIAETPAD